MVKQLQQSGTPTSQDSNTPTPGWLARISYFLLLVLPVILLTKELSARRFPGQFFYPDYFGLFKFLYHLQEALLIGMIVAFTGILAARVPSRLLRFACYLPISTWVVWLVVWAIVRAAFMMELSPQYVIELLVRPTSIHAVGLSPSSFYPVLIVSVAIVITISVAGVYLSRRITVRFADAVALFFLGVFLVVHVPVRAYVAYHVNRGQHAVLGLDDWSPISLRTEYVMPGLRERRPTLPNLEETARTRAYLEWIKVRPVHQIPRKFNIVWIVIEACRADAISEQVTPYLWSHAKEFQLKLDRNHWSGGNATQFGLFSMFTGISGYHLPTFKREGVRIPFFTLLEQNGYRVRLGKRRYFRFTQFQSLLPDSILSGRAEGATFAQTDAAMTEALLVDMNLRPAAPSVDIVTFDATHWPFSYPPEDDLFKPAGPIATHARFTRTAAEAGEAFNRYRNASHFIDRQIEKIIESLRARGALDHTIVLIMGDHGEEFMERGQVFHCGAMNDYQGRSLLWIHFPDALMSSITNDQLTSHTDIIPTLLDFLGFKEDVLRTQGQSLLHPTRSRTALLVSEQGYFFPYYNALVTKDYITRWRNRRHAFSFSGVERRDGRSVVGDEWLSEAKAAYPIAAREYEILPDPAAPLQKWSSGAVE